METNIPPHFSPGPESWRPAFSVSSVLSEGKPFGVLARTISCSRADHRGNWRCRTARRNGNLRVAGSQVRPPRSGRYRDLRQGRRRNKQSRDWRPFIQLGDKARRFEVGRAGHHRFRRDISRSYLGRGVRPAFMIGGRSLVGQPGSMALRQRCRDGVYSSHEGQRGSDDV
jgi:hypothetical protein